MGHIVGEGVINGSGKDYPLPKSLKSLRRFLGMVGWYRKFVENVAYAAAPLTGLLKPKQRFHMTPEGKQAFEKLKQKLCSAPVLRSPDFSKPFFKP